MKRGTEELFLNNMALVTTIADKHYKKFIGYGIDFEDIRQVGYIGLIKACERFDNSKGVKFSTYAWKLIEGEILNFILQDRHNFKITTKKGVKTKQGIKHYNFEKSLNPVSVTFKTDSLLLDLERVLDKRELYILKKIYYENEKVGEVAKDLNLSRTYIGVIKNKAFMKIQKNLQIDL